MKTILLIAGILASAVLFAQKTVTCKKGSIKLNGELIARYDGVGGFFREVKMGVFATDSKDTLIKISELSYDPKNPLFDARMVYKVEFRNSNHLPFYVHNPKNPNARFMERDVMEMIFNDSVPVLIRQNKLDGESLEKFRANYSYDLDKVTTYIKSVEDSIALINKTEISRDLTQPVTFRLVNNGSVSPYDVNKVFEIYQGGVLLGRMVKKVSPGQYSKAEYTFWKTITPVTIGGIDMKYSPVAYCNTSSTPFEIPVISVVDKKEYKIKGDYANLDMQIANLLVAFKLL